MPRGWMPVGGDSALACLCQLQPTLHALGLLAWLGADMASQTLHLVQTLARCLGPLLGFCLHPFC